jgi:PAS domain S-box-containing protein
MPLVLVIFLVAFYLVYEDIKDRTTSEFNNEQLILAKTAAQGITSLFHDYQSNLTFLAKLKGIVDYTDDTKTLMADFYENHKDILVAITRVDNHGIIMYTYPVNQSVIGSDISYQKHVRQIIETHQPVISDVFLAAQGYLAIALHVPIFKEDQYNGSLAILIPIDKLGQLYLGKMKIRGTGNVWLLSENGIELFCPLKGHTGKSFLDITHHDASAIDLLDRIKTQNSGISDGIHQETIENEKSGVSDMYIAFYRAPLGNTYWTVLISCKKKDIFVTLTRLRNRLFLIFTLLFTIISFYFYSLVKVRNVLKEEAKRKKAEKSLQESEEKFRRLFEEHAAIKLLIDPKTGGIIDANKSAAKFYGWTREELKKMKLHQINILSEDEIKSRIDKVLVQGEIQFEFRHRLKNASLRDVEVYSSKIKIGEREILHSIVHDITKRKRTEEALIEAKKQAEESDRLKSAFLQNMSHEIRTPMNAIMGFSSLLTEYYNDKPKLEQFSEIIHQRSNDLLEIINDILDISKIESGQLSINKEECNIHGLFNELTVFFQEHQKRIGKQHIGFNLHVFCKPSEYTIITDKVKLRQIFINLIGNAFKFTNSGTIEGGCKLEKNGDLLFFVSDTGIGIPLDKQGAIFERFIQLNNNSNIIYGGTGLGLSIVKGLIDLLNGRIWLNSEPGKGTTFYFTFPFLEASSKTEKVVATNTISYDFTHKTILIVEDDQFNTLYIKALLNDTGLKIIHTRLGSEAVGIAVSQSPDLILMDIRLPDINGYEATKQIRLEKPDIKIIAQTAYASFNDKQLAMEAGCNDYISKPLKRELLLEMINRYLHKQIS